MLKIQSEQMSLLDKILDLFRPAGKSPKLVEPITDKKVKPIGNEEAEIAIGPLILRKKYAVKYTTTMINTITLSSDMKTLFLIDDGRAIAFPLDTDNGVLIAAIRGQIVVATALSQDEEEGGGAEGGEVEGERAKPSTAEIIKLPVDKNQWTFVYRKSTAKVGIIGTVDIDATFREENDDCESHVISLEEKIIKVRRAGAEIIVSVFDN